MAISEYITSSSTLKFDYPQQTTISGNILNLRDSEWFYNPVPTSQMFSYKVKPVVVNKLGMDYRHISYNECKDRSNTEISFDCYSEWHNGENIVVYYTINHKFNSRQIEKYFSITIELINESELITLSDDKNILNVGYLQCEIVGVSFDEYSNRFYLLRILNCEQL